MLKALKGSFLVAVLTGAGVTGCAITSEERAVMHLNRACNKGPLENAFKEGNFIDHCHHKIDDVHLYGSDDNSDIAQACREIKAANYDPNKAQAILQKYCH